MELYERIAFAILFVCAAGQFWFVRNGRRILIDRHPQTWLALSKKSFVSDAELAKFMLLNGGRGVEDEEFHRFVRQFRWLFAVASACWAFLLLGMAGLLPKLYR